MSFCTHMKLFILAKAIHHSRFDVGMFVNLSKHVHFVSYIICGLIK